jgi:hypothetical protein
VQFMLLASMLRGLRRLCLFSFLFIAYLLVDSTALFVLVFINHMNGCHTRSLVNINGDMFLLRSLS